MAHWLVYHSQKTVNHSYLSLGEHAVYSKKAQTKLCFGDWIWVIDGSTDQPTRYTLVDCFRYKDTGYSPFRAPYSKFELKIIGTESLLRAPIELDASSGWARDVRDRFVTKQRFFVNLHQEPEIVAGLLEASGVRI